MVAALVITVMYPEVAATAIEYVGFTMIAAQMY